jgi:hypothetical protein
MNGAIPPLPNKLSWHDDQLKQLHFIYKKDDKVTAVIMEVLSLLTTTQKMLPNILVSRLILYVGTIIVVHQCEF